MIYVVLALFLFYPQVILLFLFATSINLYSIAPIYLFQYLAILSFFSFQVIIESFFILLVLVNEAFIFFHVIAIIYNQNTFFRYCFKKQKSHTLSLFTFFFEHYPHTEHPHILLNIKIVILPMMFIDIF